MASQPVVALGNLKIDLEAPEDAENSMEFIREKGGAE
jgi:hypothetical protein